MSNNLTDLVKPDESKFEKSKKIKFWRDFFSFPRTMYTINDLESLFKNVPWLEPGEVHLIYDGILNDKTN